MDSKAEYDVLIVGYGMLGNVAALLLAHWGMRVVVVEKKKASDVLLTKSARIDDEVLLVLEQLGLGEQMKQILHPLQGTQVIDKKERVLLEFNEEKNGNSAPLYGFYQPDLQQLLQKEATKHRNITIWDACEVENFEQDEEKVEVFVSRAGATAFQNITVSYLLVCNGQHSRIADFLDIDVENFNYESAVLCVDTVCKNEKVAAQRYAQTIYDADLPVVRITNDNRHQRWEFQIGNDQIAAAATPEKVRSLLTEFSSLELDVTSAFVYEFEARMLTNWVVKRVLIAGDAAHIMPPYLGMGLAAGIKDVYNLAWKLKLVHEEVCSVKLLDTYQSERAANVRYLIQLNLWIKRLFKSSKLRWIKGFVPVIPKWFLKRQLNTQNVLKSGIVGKHSKGAGKLMHSPKVGTQKGEVLSLNQALKTEFVVIALGQNPVDALQPNQVEFLAGLRAQFIHLTPAKQKFVQDGRYAQNLYDKEGEIQTWLQQHKAEFVIIRPDRMVYDFCSNIAELNQAVWNLEQQLPMRQLAYDSITF